MAAGIVVIALLAVVLLALAIHVRAFALRHLALARAGEEYGFILHSVIGFIQFALSGGVWILAIATVLTIALSLRPSALRPALLGLAVVELLVATQLFFLRLMMVEM